MLELLTALVVIVFAIVALELFFPAAAAMLALALERARSGLSLERAGTSEFDFSYLVGGKGQTLLLIHGFGADKDNFTRIARHLKKRFRVIAVDLPGFGDSTRLAGRSYRIPEQSQRLHAIVERLGLDQFHLGGSSMGGAIAIDYAATHPEKVISLWLLAPGGVMRANDSEMISAYRNKGLYLLVVERARDFARLLKLVMTRQPFFPRSLKLTLGRRAAADAGLHRKIFDDMAASPDSEDRGRAVGAPALIVWGREDRVLDVSGAPILHAAMRASSLNIMDGIGHLPMLESPKQAARDYIAFVDGL